MKELQIEIAIKLLKKAVKDSNRMFDEKEQSEAYIIGMLQGTINAMVEHLQSTIDEKDLAMIEKMEADDFGAKDIGYQI
jgi:hypothetical protein